MNGSARSEGIESARTNGQSPKFASTPYVGMAVKSPSVPIRGSTPKIDRSDGLNEGQTPQPTSFSASSSSPTSNAARLGVWGLVGVVLVGVVLFVLHYFEVIYLGEMLPFLPSTSLRTSPSKSGGGQNLTKDQGVNLPHPQGEQGPDIGG